MIKSKLILNDRAKLSISCDPYPKDKFDEALELGKHLLKLCKQYKGIGLAAPQIGIYKRVAVINVIEPIICINLWKVWESESKVIFREGCLSFPKKIIQTERSKFAKFSWIDSEFQSQVRVFGPSMTDKTGELQQIMECVCFQHEEDHLSGRLMFDYEVSNAKVNAS